MEKKKMGKFKGKYKTQKKKKKKLISTKIRAAGGFLAHSGRATGVTYR